MMERDVKEAEKGRTISASTKETDMGTLRTERWTVKRRERRGGSQ